MSKLRERIAGACLLFGGLLISDEIQRRMPWSSTSVSDYLSTVLILAGLALLFPEVQRLWARLHVLFRHIAITVLISTLLLLAVKLPQRRADSATNSVDLPRSTANVDSTGLLIDCESQLITGRGTENPINMVIIGKRENRASNGRLGAPSTSTEAIQQEFRRQYNRGHRCRVVNGTERALLLIVVKMNVALLKPSINPDKSVQVAADAASTLLTYSHQINIPDIGIGKEWIFYVVNSPDNTDVGAHVQFVGEATTSTGTIYISKSNPDGLLIFPHLDTPSPSTKPLAGNNMTQPQSRIRRTNVVVVPTSTAPAPPWPLVNIYFDNAGTLPATAVTNNVQAVITDREISARQVEAMQDALLTWDGWSNTIASRESQEMHPGDAPQFMSIPFEDGQLANDLRREFDQIAQGRLYLYIFVAWKYRDSSMSVNVLGVTEDCFWFSGGNFARHNCGRQRVFQERLSR